MNYLVSTFDWTKTKANRIMKIDFVRFGIVGSIGFLVNLICLTLLYKHLKVEVVVSQIISGEVALLSNFTFHNFWTFKGHEHIPFYKKLLQFHATQWSGQLIILAVVSLGVKLFKFNYVYSLIIASGLVMVWNFGWTKYYIFNNKKNTTFRK